MSPRIASKVLNNELRLSDPVSGEVITFYYRLPTTKERSQYENAKIRRERNKLKFEVGETKLKFGKLILQGFKETEVKEDGSKVGGFTKIEDGKEIIFASDPNSKNYDQNWKDLLELYASDLICALATHLFDGVMIEDEDITGEEEETETDDASEGIDEKK